MEVRTLFFAAYREAVGRSELTLRLDPGSTVDDLVRGLRERGEPWSRIPPAPAVAVNRSYSGMDTPLSEGDEVAFIPPVAGG